MTIIIIIIGYLLSVWISRWFVIQTYKKLSTSTDGVDIFFCLIPVFNLMISIVLYSVHALDDFSDKFFKTK